MQNAGYRIWDAGGGLPLTRNPWNPSIRKPGIALVILVLANLAFLLGFVLPARTRYLEQTSSLSSLQSRVRSLRQTQLMFSSYARTVKETQDFRASLPKRDEVNAVVAKVTRTVRGLDLELPSVDYRPAEDKREGLLKLTFLLGVEGKYAQVRRFLYELMKYRRFLVIEKLVLKGAGERDRVQLQLEMAAYFR